MVIVAKPKKHVSPRLINAMMVGMTRRNTDPRRISECDAYEDQSWGNDEVEAAETANLAVGRSLIGSVSQGYSNPPLNGPIRKCHPVLASESGTPRS